MLADCTDKRELARDRAATNREVAKAEALGNVDASPPVYRVVLEDCSSWHAVQVDPAGSAVS